MTNECDSLFLPIAEFIGCFIAICATIVFFFPMLEKWYISGLFVLPSHNPLHPAIYTGLGRFIARLLARGPPRRGMRRARRRFPAAFVSPRVALSTHIVCVLALQIRTSKPDDHFPADRILFRFFVIDRPLARTLARIAVTGDLSRIEYQYKP